MAKDLISLGKKGESLVEEYLKNLGFIIESKNFRAPLGEIDLIARKNDLLSFVEVKLRVDPAFYLSQLISYPKQKKIISAALYYLSNYSYQNMIYRFDVALVENINHDYKIQYIENAFNYSKFCNV